LLGRRSLSLGIINLENGYVSMKSINDTEDLSKTNHFESFNESKKKEEGLGINVENFTEDYLKQNYSEMIKNLVDSGQFNALDGLGVTANNKRF